MAKKIIHIQIDEVRRLGALQCTVKELASFFGCTKKRMQEILDTMPEVKKAYEEGMDGGKISLRRKQFRLASTNASMAIFLGKQMLEQEDVNTTELTGPGGGPIENIDLTKLTSDERNQLRQLFLKSRQSGTSS